MESLSRRQILLKNWKNTYQKSTMIWTNEKYTQTTKIKTLYWKTLYWKTLYWKTKKENKKKRKQKVYFSPLYRNNVEQCDWRKKGLPTIIIQVSQLQELKEIWESARELFSVSHCMRTQLNAWEYTLVYLSTTLLCQLVL